MQHTVTFQKSSVENGRTLLHECTICETDITSLKRQVTKILKEIEPFDQLQKECPIQWESFGYGNSVSWSKKWSSYTRGNPLNDDTNYIISITKTSRLLETASSKVYEARSKVEDAYEELTKNTHAFNPDISKIDPELDEIISTDLPPRILALKEIIESVETRIRDKIKELNEMTE